MAEIFDLQKARAFEHCQEYEHCDAGGIIEAACEEIERLRADVDGLVEALAGDDGDVAVNVCINSREQAKRIQALEAALKEAYAKRIVLDGDCEARTPIKNSLIFKCDKSVTCNWETCPRKDEIFEEAKEKLIEEGLL